MIDIQPTGGFGHWMKVAIRIFAVLGFLLSLYLLVLRLTGKVDTLAGCGGTGGCANVLGSAYSQWFGIPVTAISAALYLGLLAITFRPDRKIGLALGVAFVGAALWFAGVQGFILKAFCPWCLGAHLIGVASALCLLLWLRPWKSFSGPVLGAPVLAGLASVAALALGQIFGPKPDTHRLSELSEGSMPISPPTAHPLDVATPPAPQPETEPEVTEAPLIVVPAPVVPMPPVPVAVPEPPVEAVPELVKAPAEQTPSQETKPSPIIDLTLDPLPFKGEAVLPSTPTPAPPVSKPVATPSTTVVAFHARGNGRKITLLNGRKQYAIENLPGIGPLDAKHVLVEYFDYTCASCGDLHGDLAELLRRNPKDIRLVLLPMPLNRKCNQHLHPDVRDHPGACEMAALSMAAFRADPSKFREVHDTLFGGRHSTFGALRDQVARIVGAEALQRAAQDPWVREIVLANANDYPLLTKNGFKMPKLLVGGNQIMEGVAREQKVFIDTLEHALGL